MATDLDNLLTPGGVFTAEDIAAAQTATGQQKAAGPQVWFPGKTRKYRDYATEYESGDNVYEKGRLQPAKERVTESPGAQDSEAVKAWVYDPEKRKQIISYLEKRGFPTDDLSAIENAWFSAVDRAQTAYMGAGLEKSPWDMLDLMTPPKDQGGPRKGLSFDSTQRDVDMAEMPPEMVRQGIEGTLQQLLGRGPTETEVNDFAARAAAIAAEDPYTRTTTSHQKWDDELEQYVNTGSTTEESGVSQAELNAQTTDMARQDAEGSDERMEFGRSQAINILMGMMGGG